MNTVTLAFVVILSFSFEEFSLAIEGDCKTGITEVNKGQNCPGCKSSGSSGADLTLEKLTVGNENNTVSLSNIGEVCIKGSAQIPVGFIKPSDTVDVRPRVWFQVANFKAELPCESIQVLLQTKFMNK